MTVDELRSPSNWSVFTLDLIKSALVFMDRHLLTSLGLDQGFGAVLESLLVFTFSIWNWSLFSSHQNTTEHASSFELCEVQSNSYKATFILLPVDKLELLLV